MVIGYGIDEIVHIISRELLAAGYDVTVLTTWLGRSMSNQEIEIRELSPLRPFLLSEYWHRHFLTDLRCIRTFTEELKEYDMVMTCDPMHVIGAAAKIRFKKPVIMYYFGVVPPNVLDSFSRKVESYRQRMTWYPSFLMADYIMTNSKYTKSLLPSTFQKRALVNYHGIEHLELKEDNVEKFKNELNLEDKKVILSVGRFSSSYKGMREIIRIFARFNKGSEDAVLILVGGGEIGNSDEYKPHRDLRILTNVSYETLKLCFASCDVYCTASRWEGFDIPLLAAQANGKPVIAFNVGAHPEVMIDGKTGFLASDWDDFEHRLELLLNDSSLRKRMGEIATNYAKSFTWKKSIRAIETLIDATCRNYDL